MSNLDLHVVGDFPPCFIAREYDHRRVEVLYKALRSTCKTIHNPKKGTYDNYIIIYNTTIRKYHNPFPIPIPFAMCLSINTFPAASHAQTRASALSSSSVATISQSTASRRSWRCHWGGCGDIMRFTTQCLKKCGCGIFGKMELLIIMMILIIIVIIIIMIMIFKKK